MIERVTRLTLDAKFTREAEFGDQFQVITPDLPGFNGNTQSLTPETIQAALAGLSAMESWFGELALAGIKSPTLVLWGDGDRAYLWPQPEQLWRRIEGAKLAVIPGCSHAVHLEKSHLFNATLGDLLVGD